MSLITFESHVKQFSVLSGNIRFSQQHLMHIAKYEFSFKTVPKINLDTENILSFMRSYCESLKGNSKRPQP